MGRWESEVAASRRRSEVAAGRRGSEVATGCRGSLVAAGRQEEIDVRRWKATMTQPQPSSSSSSSSAAKTRIGADETSKGKIAGLYDLEETIGKGTAKTIQNTSYQCFKAQFHFNSLIISQASSSSFPIALDVSNCNPNISLTILTRLIFWYVLELLIFLPSSIFPFSSSPPSFHLPFSSFTFQPHLPHRPHLLIHCGNLLARTSTPTLIANSLFPLVTW